MMRLPSKFYKELQELRSKYGHQEYDRDELLPAAMALLIKYDVDQEALLRDEANMLLDRAEKAEDKAGEGLFPYDAQTALGEKRRINRGRMALGQLYRRKIVIDTNLAGQQLSWGNETHWLNERIIALSDHPPGAVVEDVVPEQKSAA
jgi:hypothetical protein